MLYYEKGQDSLSNLYNIKIANKTARSIPLTLQVEGTQGSVQIVGERFINVKREDESAGTFFVVLPKNVVKQRKTVIHIGLYEGGKKIDEIKTNFLGPF
jgi:hypothetical protein